MDDCGCAGEGVALRSRRLAGRPRQRPVPRVEGRHKMSSSNQATDLSMDDILASIRRIIAEEPNAKGKPKMANPVEPSEPAREASPEIAQRGARSSFNHLTQRLNEVLETPRDSPFERKAEVVKDPTLGLDQPEDLDQPYKATRKPPPLPEPAPAEAAAPTRVVSSTSNELLRRHVWSQNDGNIKNRLGRLDPKPLTTALARAVGGAPMVAFDAFRRKSEADTQATGRAGQLPPPPPLEQKQPSAPPLPTVEAQPTEPPATPSAAKSPSHSPSSPTVPAPPIAAFSSEQHIEDEEGLADRLAASMRELDATLVSTSAKPGDKKPVETAAPEADQALKGRGAAGLPTPKPWPEAREKANEATQSMLAAETKPTESKPEARTNVPVEPSRPLAAEKTARAPEIPSARAESKDDLAGFKAKSAAPLKPASDKQVTAAEAAAMLIKAAAPPSPAIPAVGPAIYPDVKSTKPTVPATWDAGISPKPAAPVSVASTAAKLAPAATVAAPAVAPGVRTLEDAVSDLLRPVLRQWLDEHMPRIFEKVLREELAGRVTSPPRS
ncbi:MAG: DUF2497 domain-containing protein [Hyphomicrobiaceae bacterium]|nr:MAG: DUF2497 domain-containing protein [Hyphomicrobiaceae bacterium]